MAKNDFCADVIRGWPGDGAVDRVEPVKAGVYLYNGDLVEKQSDGTVDRVGGTENTGSFGLVVRGNADSGAGVMGAAAASGGQAVVLWSNYTVRIKASNTPTAIGSQTAVAQGISGTVTAYGATKYISVQNNKFIAASTQTVNGGFCVNVTPASSQNDATYTIVVR